MIKRRDAARLPVVGAEATAPNTDVGQARQKHRTELAKLALSGRNGVSV